MKYKIHVPTEQFGFCEVEFEPAEGRHIIDIYREVSEMFKTKEGVDEKRMNTFIDNQLLANGKNHIEVYNQMSEVQKNVVQQLKKGLKRIAAKEVKEIRFTADDSGPGKGENGDYSGMD